VFDIYTIVFLAVAVFIFLRLRRVLGQRTGRERHPYDLSSTHDAPRPSRNDNVVGVPGQGGASQDSSWPSEPPKRWNAPAEEGSAAAAGLDGIAREDRSFDAKAFVAGARAAYEMIVTAYAEGDRRTLKNLLSREVYDGFKTAIQERESRREKAETRFVSAAAVGHSSLKRSLSTTDISARSPARVELLRSGHKLFPLQANEWVILDHF
jgi:predicted lipid-binding transport protein (Tim44 family)